MQMNTLGAVSVDLTLTPGRPRRLMKVWEWSYLQHRLQYGHYDTLMYELYHEGPALYRNYTRMDRALFNEIVECLTSHIQKKGTNWRKATDSGMRVAIILRFLATSISYKSLRFTFRVTLITISNIALKTYNTIVTVYCTLRRFLQPGRPSVLI